jgi:hypothetical protein
VTDDPDASRVFTLREKQAYNPKQCPHCGKRSLWYSFAGAARMAEMQDKYRRGTPSCKNRECPVNSRFAYGGQG